MSQMDAIRCRTTCTVPEAGEVLGIGRDAAYRAAHDGTIPTLRLGRRLVVPVPKLLALIGLAPENGDGASATDALIVTTGQDFGGPRHVSEGHKVLPSRIA
jgi:excisionase family DNA binding protein